MGGMSEFTMGEVGERIVAVAVGRATADFWKDVAQLRAELAGRHHSDSGEILRAARDGRNRPNA